MISRFGPRTLQWGMGLWPPFFGAGIKVERINDDWTEVIVSMKLRWFNKNYFGTHFGGSLFSMTDPFYALMVVKALGKDYIVWDRSSTIAYEAPGRGRVRATFTINDEIIEGIRAATADGEKHFVTLPVDVVDQQDEVIAQITKTLYVRRKKSEGV